jgi:hypothetical protein
MSVSIVKRNPAIASFETREGDCDIYKCDDGSFRICVDGVDRHGVCQAETVIAWLSNALHNAEYMLIKHNI